MLSLIFSATCLGVSPNPRPRHEREPSAQYLPSPRESPSPHDPPVSSLPPSFNVHQLPLLLLFLFLLLKPAAGQKVAVSERLQGLDAEVKQVMSDWHVPGIAIAIVTDTSVVWIDGFGKKNVETDAPVTERILFPIGSTTMAFTAAGLGILHDEGKLDWITPTREYLPRFRMKDDFATAEMTVVDLMTHRSGLRSHDAL